MGYTVFRASDVEIVSAHESVPGAFRDKNGDSTLDETNGAGDTYYYPPFLREGNNITIVRSTREVMRMSGDGSRHVSKVNRSFQRPIQITISGKMINNSWDFFVYDGITTVEATPNTHTFTLSSQSLTTPPPSMELLVKIPNQGDASDTILLFVGCIITGKSYTGSIDGVIEVTYTLEAAREITGTDLSAWPTVYDERVFLFSDAVLTLQKGGTDLRVTMESFTFEVVNDGKKLLKGDGSLYPEEALAPMSTRYNLRATLRLREDIIANLRLDPTAANNLDFNLKISRDTSTDYVKEDWADGYMELDGDPVWQDNYLVYNVIGYYNPEEASGEYTHTEYNDLDDDRYET